MAAQSCISTFDDQRAVCNLKIKTSAIFRVKLQRKLHSFFSFMR
ncbi:hypothetical protein HMPREF0541_01685 [Lacticaseibacillus rhamnosus ATCC 21052]|nr:hypothetical protein HMPREF0541_01685 [Lacticaseibacillus rhamnosus ATCC 21052]